MARPRYGYRRLHVLLKREGWVVGHRTVFKHYTDMGLGVRTKRRRKLVARPRVMPAPGKRLNACWSIDFTSDQLDLPLSFVPLAMLGRSG